MADSSHSRVARWQVAGMRQQLHSNCRPPCAHLIPSHMHNIYSLYTVYISHIYRITKKRLPIFSAHALSLSSTLSSLSLSLSILPLPSPTSFLPFTSYYLFFASSIGAPDGGSCLDGCHAAAGAADVCADNLLRDF